MNIWVELDMARSQDALLTPFILELAFLPTFWQKLQQTGGFHLFLFCLGTGFCSMAPVSLQIDILPQP